MSNSSSLLSLESFRELSENIGWEEKKVQQSAPGSKKLDQYVQQHQVINAEIWLSLKVVKSKMLLRSCEQLNLLFSAMVNDSNIVKSFQLGNNNCGYYLNYGVAPFFESEITKVLNESPCYSVSVDESLSKIFQLEQMDLNVKFRDDELGVAKVIIILPFLFWNVECGKHWKWDIRCP